MRGEAGLDTRIGLRGGIMMGRFVDPSTKRCKVDTLLAVIAMLRTRHSLAP